MNRHCRFHVHKQMQHITCHILFYAYLELPYFIKHMWINVVMTKCMKNYKIRIFADLKAMSRPQGSAHNTDQLVTGQRMIALSRPQVSAWHNTFGHGSVHGICESTIWVSAFPTAQCMEHMSRPMVDRSCVNSVF